MKTMRKLYDHAMKELDDVIEYSKLSMMYASSDPELSKLYYNLAKGEMDDARSLHDASKKLASSKIGTEDVDPMLMELWEEMESEKIDKMGQARACLENAKG